MAGRGQPKTGGRSKGTPNRVTKVMRDEWLAAYEAEGGVEYLRRVAREEPATFVRGLVRMIPNELAAQVDSEVALRVVDRSDARRDDLADEPREPAADERQPLELRDAPRDLPAATPTIQPEPVVPAAWVTRWLDEQESADL